jgi:hypothetical protein
MMKLVSNNKVDFDAARRIDFDDSPVGSRPRVTRALPPRLPDGPRPKAKSLAGRAREAFPLKSTDDKFREALELVSADVGEILGVLMDAPDLPYMHDRAITRTGFRMVDIRNNLEPFNALLGSDGVAKIVNSRVSHHLAQMTVSELIALEKQSALWGTIHNPEIMRDYVDPNKVVAELALRLAQCKGNFADEGLPKVLPPKVWPNLSTATCLDLLNSDDVHEDVRTSAMDELISRYEAFGGLTQEDMTRLSDSMSCCERFHLTREDIEKLARPPSKSEPPGWREHAQMAFQQQQAAHWNFVIYAARCAEAYVVLRDRPDMAPPFNAWHAKGMLGLLQSSLEKALATKDALGTDSQRHGAMLALSGLRRCEPVVDQLATDDFGLLTAELGAGVVKNRRGN